MQTDFCYEYLGAKGRWGNIYFKPLQRYTFIMPCNDTVISTLQCIVLWEKKIKKEEKACIRLILSN